MRYSICDITPELIHSVFDLATKVFVADSTLHRALGIELDVYRSYLWPSFCEMVGQGHSLAAVSQDTQEVVGCVIAADFAKPLEKQPIVPKEFTPLLALATRLSRDYVKHREVTANEALLVDMGAVSTEYRGSGLYRTLRQAVQARAKQSGFKHIIGELSSAATQHVILDKLGHHKVSEVIFADFAHKGTYPFSSIRSPHSIILSEGQL